MASPNSREAQLGRMIAAAQAAGLTVHAVEAEGRRVRLFTSPLAGGLPESQPAEDDADRWLREQLEGPASGGASRPQASRDGRAR